MTHIEDIVTREAFHEWLDNRSDDEIINDFPNIPISYWLMDMFHREIQVKQYMIIVKDLDEEGDMEFTTPDWMDFYIESFIMSDTERAGEWKEYFSDSNNNCRLFVYGTLKSGYGNNRLMRPGKFIKKACLDGYILSGNGVPFAIESPGDHIIGELWEVPKYQMLGPIDSLEGHPYFYTRTWVKDQLGGTWFYLCKESIGDTMFDNGYNEWPTNQYYRKRKIHV